MSVVNTLILKLFPEGQRKVMVSLIAIAVGVAMERLGGGLSNNMENALVALVAIFTGGNVIEHIAAAIKVLKGSKAGAIIEDLIPGDQGLREDPVRVETMSSRSVVGSGSSEALRQEFINEMQAVVTTVGARLNNSDQQVMSVQKDIAEVKDQMRTQAQNVADIVKILNSTRGGANVGKQA